MIEQKDDLNLKLQEFRIWALTIGKYAPSTVQRAIRRIKQLSKVFNVLAPDQDKIMDYIARMIEKGAKAHSLNNQMKDLRAWLNFLNIDIKTPRLKEPESSDPWVPTDNDVEKLLRAANTMDKSTSIRNRVILDILFQGGIRIGELIRINLNDIREDGIFIHSEKGEKDRQIILTDDAMKRLQNYIEYYRSQSDPAALFTTKNGRITYAYARNLMVRIRTRAGIPLFHAHAARHYCASALLKSGVDIRMVQIFLGHKSLRSTERYTHITNTEVNEVVKQKLQELFQDYQSLMQNSESRPVPSGAERI